jgi:hypothetical protein
MNEGVTGFVVTFNLLHLAENRRDFLASARDGHMYIVRRLE